MMFNEYGLEGVMEQSRVTGIGVQEMARKSPGAGITAMQMLTALRTGVMIPLHKQQAEGSKTLAGLIRADKGGLDLPADHRCASGCGTDRFCFHVSEHHGASQYFA